MPAEPGQSIKHYRLVEKIGAGGMGVVWKAVDTTLEREVAVKLLPEEATAEPELLNRLRQEAKAIAALNHPGIVTIYSVEESDGTHFITMELVGGQPLGRLIGDGGLPAERFFEIAVPLADAVAAAHQSGVLHRDLKPDNIMVAEDGRVKVLDFGLAKLRPQPLAEPDGSRLATRTATSDGHIAGTVPYMSPEQVRGESLDHRTDLFSLGIILYEMIAGRRPFQGKSFGDLAASILRDTPSAVTEVRRDIPGPLGGLIQRCLEKDPRRRLDSAATLRDELVALKEARSAPTAPAEQEKPSIVVLPFADMSPDQDQGYFCEGMADEIITALAKIRGLRVVSRRTAFKFKGSDDDTREIGRRLGVSTILEGGVRKAANRLRITVSLVGVEGDSHLWSERYDRDLEDVFAVQEEIARKIVDALRVTLTPQETRAIAKPVTTDLQAYDYYLRGRNYLYRWGRRNIEFACQMFVKAIEIDPAYALAYAGIADCQAVLYSEYGKRKEHLKQALDASRKATELQPDLAAAHSARGIALSHAGQYADAEREFEQAIDLDPMLFEAHYFHARASFAQGKKEEAARHYEVAARVRPDDYQAPKLLSTVYTGLGREDDAREMNRRALRIIEKHLELHPDDVRARYFGAGALVELGDRERGVEWIRKVLEMDPDDSDTLYNVACVYSLAGAVEEAMDCLEKTVRIGAAKSIEWVQQDSDLDPLRGHPRFKDFLKQLK